VEDGFDTRRPVTNLGVIWTGVVDSSWRGRGPPCRAGRLVKPTGKRSASILSRSVGPTAQASEQRALAADSARQPCCSRTGSLRSPSVLLRFSGNNPGICERPPASRNEFSPIGYHRRSSLPAAR